MQVNAVSSQVTKTSVCVSVCQEQSVLGLEVEVISLIGTPPPPRSLSLCHPALPMMLFSAIPSLPYYLSQSFSFFALSLLNSITLLLSVPFHFALVFCRRLPVISSKRTGNRDIDCGKRSRPE